MQITQLLTQITHFGQTFEVELNWIGELIKGLITGVGSVGVGVILFSVILKLIVLPFDIYQRISMRKQNIKMKANQEKMEKLQKQYANDKDKYNQKVMEMYKESGISMFSSCLPMILSMVIFFVAIGAFNSYSQYANIRNYNILVEAYNEKVESYAPEATQSNVTVDGGIIYVRPTEAGDYLTIQIPDDAEKTDKLAYVNDVLAYKVYDADGKVISAQYILEANGVTKMEAELGDTLAPFKEGKTATEACKAYLLFQTQNYVVTKYEDTASPQMSFLWIKNVWATDAAYKHPLVTFDEATSTLTAGRDKFSVNGKGVSFDEIKRYSSAYNPEAYDLVTGKLSAQKAEANGYFILIVLSIGTMLLSQFISMRSQKEQNKYSSVDGQGASQQKTMMIVMTVMFGFFAFMYSAAFSIYMVMSNVLSLISTVVINKLVDISMSKKEEKELQEKYNQRFPGRRK